MLFAPELKEKDFIKEGDPNSPKWWLWVAIILAILGIMWLAASWVQRQFYIAPPPDSPFEKVTNRQFSVFSYQFPVALPSGKLENIKENADKFVSARPDILFLYHTWKRQLGNIFSARPISSIEFRDFLKDTVIWDPSNWREAPDGYILLMKELATMGEKDLQALPETSLPQVVRRAFQGWKNQTIEVETIKQQKISFGEMQEFISIFPNYTRPFWRNIYPEYLKTLKSGKFDSKDVIKEEEIPEFLRLGFYNNAQSKLGK